MKARSAIVATVVALAALSPAGIYQSRKTPSAVFERLEVIKIDGAGNKSLAAVVEQVTKSTDLAFARKLKTAQAMISSTAPWYMQALRSLSPALAQALVVNAGETALRDCFIGTCTTASSFKFHGLGSGSTAAAETDTTCETEFTTQYNPDSTRATGSQTNNGANVYRSVGTNTVDASATARNFCLMSAASGGTMWTKIVFAGDIALSSGDGVQTTYDLTIE